MTVAHIVGARPQFIKAAMVSRALRAHGIGEALVHTGQHYDDIMSEVFFRELDLPEPRARLSVESILPGSRAGEMLLKLQKVLHDLRPDVVLVHGDADSSLAGALAAQEEGILLAHNEAGLRSYNTSMPEEQNRVITDHHAGLLFCPLASAAERLKREGITDGVHITGDVMYDAAMYFSSKAALNRQLPVVKGEYALVTIHRQYTADHPERLKLLIGVLEAVPYNLLFPVHPRTLRRLNEHQLQLPPNVRVMDPVGYVEMLHLVRNASLILTDSGGVQKESYFFGVPCITLRPETEWVETVELGWNSVTDLDPEQVLAAIDSFNPDLPRPNIFGDGSAAERIAQIMDQIAD